MKLKHLSIVVISSIAPLLTILPSLTLPATAQQEIQRGECSARVVGEQEGSQVNMRSGPSIDRGVIAYVLVGQIVNELTERTERTEATPVGRARIGRTDNQGNIWRYVEYIPSRTRGWVRADFVNHLGCD